MKTFEGHANRVWAIDFSPDGQRLASGGIDRTVRLWHLNSGICEAVLTGRQLNLVSCLESGRTDPS